MSWSLVGEFTSKLILFHSLWSLSWSQTQTDWRLNILFHFTLIKPSQFSHLIKCNPNRLLNSTLIIIYFLYRENNKIKNYPLMTPTRWSFLFFIISNVQLISYEVPKKNCMFVMEILFYILKRKKEKNVRFNIWMGW